MTVADFVPSLKRAMMRVAPSLQAEQVSGFLI
jgi:hypothetical protein